MDNLQKLICRVDKTNNILEVDFINEIKKTKTELNIIKDDLKELNDNVKIIVEYLKELTIYARTH